MDVEDSYEGAVRRLQRLENAGIVMGIPASRESDDDDEREALRARVRDLEELASIACDDNERLQRELEASNRELQLAQHERQESRRELAETRDQVGSLQRLVAMLEESAATPAAPHAATPAPAHAPAPARPAARR